MISKEAKWDDAYKDADYSSAPVASVLKENNHLLPESGDALDLACGRAGNAQYLAKNGFHVDAVDISSVVLEGLKSFVKQQDLNISCILRDIEKEGLVNKKYDVVVVSYFLNRSLFPAILNALKPSGLLFYQTWSNNSVDNTGPKNPEFRLHSGELLALCQGLQIVQYREDGRLGDVLKGNRNEAMIVACNSLK